MSAVSLCINMDEFWNIVFTEKRIVKTLCPHLCPLLNIQHCISFTDVYIICVCRNKNMDRNILINIRVKVVNRKNEKELLFYLNILGIL